MKMLAPIFLMAIGGVAGTPAPALADQPLSYGQGEELMAKYNCQACHALDKNLSGPSLRAIAKRYASDPTAIEALEAKILNGSIGVWGPIPMPPSHVPAQDLRKLINWILQLKVT
jgi:cytochrome c